MTCNVCYLSVSVTKTGNFRFLVELPVANPILFKAVSTLVVCSWESVFVLVENNLIEILN